MTATDIDLYSRVVRHETLGEATADSTPEVWEQALPGDRLEDRRKKFMRWDYGLVEVFFARVDRQWSGSGFTIQVHRLAEAGGGPVPACLRDAYGDFRSSVPLGELTDSLAAAGLSLTEVESYSDREFSQFTSPSGRVAVYVLTDPRPDADYRVPRGGIWSITVAPAEA
ncbi:hypothetical protein [Streptomyces sp. CNQ-509]|uniref:hypothetical protein n=1 Tax=Streptomyces sp. CNQ-509 TaxID=444103 RepID=UPI0006997C9F|nr:hypothetical protein [Streptomyces sp. CNQ-509]